MRPKPAPQERPEPFHSIHMHFTKTISIFISGILSSSMVHALMVVSPGLQASINAVLVRVNPCPWNHGVFDAGLNRLLRHIGHEIDHDLTAPLHHPKDWWPLFCQSTPPPFALESAATAFASLVLHDLRLAFMAGNDVRCIALHLV